METVKVKITAPVTSDRYGEMTPGGIVATDPAYARHLVVDLGAAEYVEQAAPESWGHAPAGKGEAINASPREEPAVSVKKTRKAKIGGPDE